MICSNCGKELSENTKFCGHCGESAAPPDPAVCAACGAEMRGQFCGRCGAKAGGGVQAPPKPETPAESYRLPPESPEPLAKAPYAPSGTAPAGSKKRRGKRLLLLLAAVLFLGAAAGLWGGHYVAKNGWGNVPFAEKLTFLPFVRLDKERMETYSDPVEEPEEPEKEEPEAEEPSAPAGEETPAAPAVSLEGDWVFESREGYVLVRFNADGTYVMGTNIMPVLERIGAGPEGQYTASGAAEFTLNRGGDELARAAVTGETVKLTLDGETYALMRHAGPANDGISGVWHIVLGEAGDVYLNFLSSGDAYLGKRMPSGEIRWGIAGDDDWDGWYEHDAARGVLRMDFVDDMEWKFRRIGNYAWVEIDGEAWAMEHLGGSDAFPQPDYILSDSDRRDYTAEELEPLDSDELDLARNEIYARHGRLFDRADVQEYFDGQSWYRGTVRPDDFDDSALNEFEKRNAEIIREVEHSRSERVGGPPPPGPAS